MRQENNSEPLNTFGASHWVALFTTHDGSLPTSTRDSYRVNNSQQWSSKQDRKV